MLILKLFHGILCSSKRKMCITDLSITISAAAVYDIHKFSIMSSRYWLWCFILHFSLFDELSLNQTLIWTGYLRFMFHFLLYDIVISLRTLWFEVISTWCANWLSVVLHQTLIRLENRCQQIAAIRIGINCNRKHNYKSPISDEISCPPDIRHC